MCYDVGFLEPSWTGVEEGETEGAEPGRARVARVREVAERWGKEPQRGRPLAQGDAVRILSRNSVVYSDPRGDSGTVMTPRDAKQRYGYRTRTCTHARTRAPTHTHVHPRTHTHTYLSNLNHLTTLTDTRTSEAHGALGWGSQQQLLQNSTESNTMFSVPAFLEGAFLYD